MTDLSKVLNSARVIPLAEVTTSAQAFQVANLLREFGHSHIEIPLRHPGALEAIEAVARSGIISVGAGTITSLDQIDRAIDSGAKFGISPCLDAELVAHAKDRDFPYIPAIATPSELLQGKKQGVELFKVYPASNLGGPSFLNALSAVFPGVRFMPSGGLDSNNYAEYLKVASVAAVSGSWLTPRKLIEAADWDAISALLQNHRDQN